MTSITGTIPVSPVDMKARKELDIRVGDTVRVHQKVQEKGKTRLQVFEGLVLAKKHGNEAGGTFTVRKVASGVGMERIFPLYSPAIDKIEIMRRSKVRRGKLYFIREKVAKEVRRQMRNMRLMNVSTEDFKEEEKPEETAEETPEAPEVTETSQEEAPVEEEKKEE